jgi:hypothetical protein
VWLCKLAEMRKSSGGVPESHLVQEENYRGGMHDNVARFVAARGFEGTEDALLALHKVVDDYYGSALDSANYNLGDYGHEYIPELIGFTCTTWHTLGGMEISDADDRRHCLRAIVNAVKM